MGKAINFYELKRELAEAGFLHPDVTDDLRQAIFADNEEHRLTTSFGPIGIDLELFRDETGRLNFTGYTGSLGAGSANWQFQIFLPDVPADEAAALLHIRSVTSEPNEDISFIPLGRQETQEQIYLHKSNMMNTQNLEFLKKSLLNLGFGDKLNKDLEQQISKGTSEFALAAKHEFNQKAVNYQLHFKAGDNEGLYFFNKYDASLNKGKENETSQTFFINKGNGITAKEAFNLMEGRAVYKHLFNKESEPYQAWLQLDPEKLTQGGNKEMKRFNENYGFNLEQVLTGKGIKEMENAESKESLLRSLRKGNAQQITTGTAKDEVKYFVTANPQFKTIDLYDHQMKRIKREELLQPAQKTAQTQKQTKQQKEVLPEKKSQSRKRKMTV